MTKDDTLKKQTDAVWILAGVILLMELLIRVSALQGLIVLLGLLELGAAIAMFVLSIFLIKKKKYGVGITFLVLASLFMLVFLIGFIFGVVIGLQQVDLTGSAIRNLF